MIRSSIVQELSILSSYPRSGFFYSDNSNFWHMAVEVALKLPETSNWSKEIVQSMQCSS
jgi:hypothetical protein